jgi:hypothetical protein
MTDVFDSNAGFSEAVLYCTVGKSVIVLPACKPFLLRCSNNNIITNYARGRIMVKRRNSKNTIAYEFILSNKSVVF